MEVDGEENAGVEADLQLSLDSDRPLGTALALLLR